MLRAVFVKKQNFHTSKNTPTKRYDKNHIALPPFKAKIWDEEAEKASFASVLFWIPETSMGAKVLIEAEKHRGILSIKAKSTPENNTGLL